MMSANGPAGLGRCGRLSKYLPDVAAIAAMYLVLLLIDVLAPPFERVIHLDDPTLSYPYAEKETVPTYLLIILTFIVPCIIISCVSFYLERRNNRDIYPAVLGFILAYGLTGLVTDVVKITAGRFRPDFYDRCQYNSTIHACTGDPSIISEGRKSFPSGHSSFSWAGLGYLSLYLAGKAYLLERPGRVWKILLVTMPLIGAYLIAISRVDDYRHHPGDVLVGGILGYFLAYVCYRQYFPALVSQNSNLPYAGVSAYEPLAAQDSRMANQENIANVV